MDTRRQQFFKDWLLKEKSDSRMLLKDTTWGTFLGDLKERSQKDGRYTQCSKVAKEQRWIAHGQGFQKIGTGEGETPGERGGGLQSRVGQKCAPNGGSQPHLMSE